MTTQTVTLQRNLLRLTALIEEPASASASTPVVFLVHGFPDTPYSWNGVAAGLLQAGFTVVRPWLRGYTAESVCMSEDYDPYTAGLDLLAWREKFAGRDVHLAGHDWGAVAAMAAVATDSSAFKSLALLAIPPFQKVERAWALLPKQMKLSAYMLEMQAGDAPARIMANEFGRLRALWTSWSPGWQFTEAEFAPVLQAFSNPGVAWAATRYYRSLFTLHRAKTRAIYVTSRKPLCVPTLVMAGIQDGCMQAELMKAMVEPACFPQGVRTVLLDACGHFLQAERPDAVLKELLDHMEPVN